MSKTFKIEKSGLPSLPLMMVATLKALKELGGSASLHEMDEKVIEMEGLTEEEQSYMMPNDKDPRVNYYLSWSRTYLRRGGALENSSRGVWTLTDKGSKSDNIDATSLIYQQVSDEEKQRAKDKRKADRKETTLAKTTTVSPDNFTTAYEEENSEEWRSRLLDTTKAMDPSAFERLAQRLLREAGFVKVEVRGQTGDGGLDGVGVLRVNLVSFQVYFQCKRYKGSVGSKEIRDFRGALEGRADKGLFITTGTFTSHAYDEATRDGAKAIDLIDGDRLCDLLKQFSLGVKTQMIEEVSVNTEWFASI